MNSVSMSPDILPQIEDLSRLISDRIGLDFPRRKWDMLQRVVADLAFELKFAGPEFLLDELLCSPLSEIRLNQLVSRLTVGETYFLRDKNVFTALRNHILPALIERKTPEQRLDLWCAASSTGEEPYSIAMLLDEKRALLENWQINFSASDINLEVIGKAKEGAYSRWSLRATPDDVKHRYFTQTGENSFLLARHIREMVSFHRLNLAAKEFVMPGLTGRLADIIFCRNVLIYFSTELQTQVVRRLVSLLQPGGWLLVSPSELGVVNDPELALVRFPGAIVHQKIDGFQTALPKAGTQPHKLDKRSALERFSGAALASYGGAGRVHKKISGSTPLRLAVGLKNRRLKSSCGVANELESEDRASGSLKEILSRVEELFQQELYCDVLELVYDGLDSLLLREEPEYAWIMAFKARSLANLGELEAAAVHAGIAVAADKVNPSFYYFSAVIARERGEFESALNFYRQTIFLDADFVMAHFSLATLLRQLGRNGVDRHLRNVIAILESVDLDSALPYAEGLSSGRLLEIARSLAGQGLMMSAE